MNRIIALLLTLSSLCIMCGCNSTRSASDASVAFYFRAVEFEYGSSDGVIVAEKRSLNEYESNYEQLIELYLYFQ